MDIPYLSLKRVTAMHGDELAQAAREVIRSGRYLQGPKVEAFEREYASYTGRKHCVTTASGLDALTLMLRAAMELGWIKDGDGVIVPANTFIATILAITENGLRPVLVEPRIDNFQIDPALVRKAVTDKTRAVMTVHLYGYNALTEEILATCGERNLPLFQDAAQAHGLWKVEDMNTRGLRGAQAHSFYPGKNMGALADAGAVTTDDDDLAGAVRALANYGSSEKYVFRYRGRNSRMDEMTAATLSVKLKYLDADNRRRRELAARYISGIRNPLVTLPPQGGVHHVFPVLCPRRDGLQAFLKARGVETIIHYPVPPHKQECYREFSSLSLPVTERIHREELSLPLNQAMTDSEADYVINAVNDFV